MSSLYRLGIGVVNIWKENEKLSDKMSRVDKVFPILKWNFLLLESFPLKFKVNVSGDH